MKKELFAELMQSAGEALEHARGKKDLRTTVLPDAPTAMRADDVRALRRRLNASQAVFAHYLNVSTQLVQAWEASRRRPEGAALRLLSIGRHAPTVVFPGLGRPVPRPYARRRSAVTGSASAGSGRRQSKVGRK